jgi:hypothetical protein
MFSFKRFINVARWDLTINSKFYTRSALFMMAIICMPVCLSYLFKIMLPGLSYIGTTDDVGVYAVIIVWIGMVYMIISSGYMFHNLLTKQGRIQEFTLPATNFERFLWHAVVTVVGVHLVFIAGVLLADLIHILFRLMVPGAEINSIFLYVFVVAWKYWEQINLLSSNHIGVILYVTLMTLCYVRTYCLVNAWKYRHNILLTCIFHFLLQSILPLIILSVGMLFSIEKAHVSWLASWLIDIDEHFTPFIICMNVFAALLYVGIWLLTYRLYKRAQLTTKRNP